MAYNLLHMFCNVEGYFPGPRTGPGVKAWGAKAIKFNFKEEQNEKPIISPISYFYSGVVCFGKRNGGSVWH